MTVVVEVDGPLTGEELNALFHAAWPGHRDTDFGPVLARRTTNPRTTNPRTANPRTTNPRTAT
ncbi:hypothetical protein [Streptomyces sp. NPDC090298]|uniref:hypothetical protein n=1 Tax=Streptomyces sp. NPDC090298 TaxID=3365959 RepID=UPI003813F4AD